MIGVDRMAAAAGSREPVTWSCRARAGMIAVLMGLSPGTSQLSAQDSTYQAWQAREAEALQRFASEQDRQFSAFLAREWHLQGLAAERAPDTTPKPRQVPLAPVDGRSGGPAVPRLSAPPSPVPAVPPPVGRPPDVGAGGSVAILGKRWLLPPPEPLPSLTHPVDREAIQRWWNALAGNPPSATLAVIAEARSRGGLPDLGLWRLAYLVARQLYPADEDAARLLAWYFLLRSGVAARVGYVDGHVQLLLATDAVVYNVPRMLLGSPARAYYAIALTSTAPPVFNRMYTYEGEYPGPLTAASLHLGSLLPGTGAPVVRELRFSYDRSDHRLVVPLDSSLVGFLAEYPRTEMPVYFAAPLSSAARQALVVALTPLITGRSERDAVNLVLRFVQTAFAYQTDEEQFHRDRPLFADETLFYPASDCEDRAVLFAELVRALFGLPVVGLHWPGHIATAVRLHAPVDGHTLTVDGQSYLVADPTYINADLGMTMPRFQGLAPEIIRWTTPGESGPVRVGPGS